MAGKSRKFLNLQEVFLEFEGTTFCQHWKGGYYQPQKDAADFVCMFVITHEIAWHAIAAWGRRVDDELWTLDASVSEVADVLVDDDELGKLQRKQIARLRGTTLADSEDLCCACEEVFPMRDVGRLQHRPGVFCTVCRTAK